MHLKKQSAGGRSVCNMFCFRDFKSNVHEIFLQRYCTKWVLGTHQRKYPIRQNDFTLIKIRLVNYLTKKKIKSNSLVLKVASPGTQALYFRQTVLLEKMPESSDSMHFLSFHARKHIILSEVGGPNSQEIREFVQITGPPG